MTLLQCPNCGLTIGFRPEEDWEFCPQCLATENVRVAFTPKRDSSQPGRHSAHAASFGIDVESDHDEHVLTLRGDLDLTSAAMLEAQIDELCLAGARQVLLDMSFVSFLDSSGMNAILRGRKACESVACAFGLISPQRPVERTLSLAGLLEKLHVRGRDRHASGRREDSA
jgi:anti-sigma B factor antagonist